MNRQLKERIVGATVIVALGIIIIPWLLDGPAHDSRPVERTLELPGLEQGGRTYTIPLDPAGGPPVQVNAGNGAEPPPGPPGGMIRRPVTESPPVETPPRTAPRSEQPAQPPPRPAPPPVDASPAPAPAPAPSPAPQPAPPPSGWTVQVGSFSQADNAQALERRLAGEGFPVFISRVATDAGTMHRVRVGPVADRDEADRLLRRLQAAGHAGARVVRAED